EKSDRAIAADMKVDKNVVSRVRKEAESTGAVAPVEKRVGADGKARKQPATKVKPVQRIKKTRPKDEITATGISHFAYWLIHFDRKRAHELVCILHQGGGDRLVADLETGIEIEESA